MDRKSDAIMDRIRDIEKKLESGSFTVVTQTEGTAKPGNVEVEKKIELPAAIPADIQQIADEWSSLVDNAEALVKGFMIESYIEDKEVHDDEDFNRSIVEQNFTNLVSLRFDETFCGNMYDEVYERFKEFH